MGIFDCQLGSLLVKFCNSLLCN
uniref:Uncharacterized protein n=1 Tax=Arundo donax TaxID=35708 RepID=A0A0A8YA81_ARUDO